MTAGDSVLPKFLCAVSRWREESRLRMINNSEPSKGFYSTCSNVKQYYKERDITSKRIDSWMMLVSCLCAGLPRAVIKRD